MRGVWRVFALCLVVTYGEAAELASGAVPGAAGAAGAEGEAMMRSTRATQAWHKLLADYARQASQEGEGSQLRPIPVDLALRDGEGRSSTLPVLLLPVPVPVPDKSAKSCGADNVAGGSSGSEAGEAARRPRPSSRPSAPEPRPGPPRRAGARRPPSRPAPALYEDNDDDAPASLRPQQPYTRFPTPNPYYNEPSPVLPTLNAAVRSEQLVQQFREQQPRAPDLPPAVIQPYIGESQPAPPPRPLQAPYPAAASPAVPLNQPAQVYGPPRGFSFLPSPSPSNDPPRPQFDRSLLIRGELKVHRADFTEPYTAWWDAESGATRVDFHDGATATYSAMLSDGRVQHLERRVERSGERPVRRCWQSAPAQPTVVDRAPPALPDMQLFSFAGYVEMEGGRAEQWHHTVSGRGGEMGGAQGEALTFRHHMLLRRDNRTQLAVPLKYSVSVDSSVLGADCDGHELRYLEVHPVQHDPQLFRFDTSAWCEQLDRTEDMSRLAPLREFTAPQRDSRYDQAIIKFKQEFGRQYQDQMEEAVRKNLFIQHSRFVSSGNREGGTFELSVNFLGDRLDAELDSLLGVTFSVEHFRAEDFPHSPRMLRQINDKLPQEFDWRPRGAVSQVRYQGSCSSCWAFAVAGSVEGALFIKTRRLVPLSEQCLVDCAHPYGGNGCRGTWPSHAYDYIQDRGLPALDQYTPYKEKVLECRDKSVPPVTHISAHVNVTQNSVPALKVAIRRHAPTVVIVDAKAKSFIFYKKGVLYDDRCGKTGAKALNHAVLAVGWGEQDRAPHFILKNSWSAAWGEGGYIRVQGPANTCGVLSLPSYPRLETDDVDRLPPGAGAAAPQARDNDDQDQTYDDLDS